MCDAVLDRVSRAELHADMSAPQQDIRTAEKQSGDVVLDVNKATRV